MPEAAEQEAPPARACHECGARQDERQEICVECGAAVPRGRTARGRAVKPLALAGFAVLVVTSAAYGVTANAGRESSAVKQAVAAVAPPQPAPPPATTSAPPAEPAPAAPTPEQKPPPQPAPPAPAPSTPPPPAPAPSTPSPTDSGGQSAPHHSGSRSGATQTRPHSTRSQPNRPAWLSEGDQPYSAALYDPYANGADEHPSQAPRAVDGSARSAWTTASHPDGLGKQGVGLVIEASGYQSYSALGIQTATPGFAVSIYSTDASDPPQGGPDQPGWTLEATKTSVAKEQRIGLKGATANPHYLIVWITKLPPGKQRAGLSEISLLP